MPKETERQWLRMRPSEIKSITFEVAFNSGTRRQCKFIRPEKIQALLENESSAGVFVAALIELEADERTDGPQGGTD